MDGQGFRDLLTLLPAHTAINSCVSIGIRTGLFDTLCQLNEPISATDLATKCGLKERILTEWIEILASAKVLSIDEKTKRCFISEEIKDVFKEQDTASKLYHCDFAATYGARQKKFLEFFKQDGPSGLPMAETQEIFDILKSNPTAKYTATFDNCFFKLVDGLQEKLKDGIEFLDVGCGDGELLRLLAERFPRCQCIGIESIDSLAVGANKEAGASGITNCRFEVCNVMKMPETWKSKFDVVLLRNVFHDVSHPQEVATEIARVVKENGVVLLFDVILKDDCELARTSRAFFTASNMFYCLPGDMGADGASPIGCVRADGLMENILRTHFSTVNVSRLSDKYVAHVCSK